MNIDDIKGRAIDIRDRLPEVRERIDAWRDELSLPETQTAETAAGAALLGVGAIAAGLNLLARRRDAWAWFLPAILLTGGAALLIAAGLERRESRIAEAEAIMRAELGDLDPIARAKVLKDIAEDELSHLARLGRRAEA